MLQFTVIFTLPLQLIKGHISNGREIVTKWEARAQVQVAPDKLRSKNICLSLGFPPISFLWFVSFLLFLLSFYFSLFLFYFPLSSFLFSHPLSSMEALSLLCLPLTFEQLCPLHFFLLRPLERRGTFYCYVDMCLQFWEPFWVTHISSHILI